MAESFQTIQENPMQDIRKDSHIHKSEISVIQNKKTNETKRVYKF